MFTGYVFCIVIADHPTVVECIRFPGRERRINIAQEIGTKYMEFGILLLEDTTGGGLHNMEQRYREDAEKISLALDKNFCSVYINNQKYVSYCKSTIDILYIAQHS